MEKKMQHWKLVTCCTFQSLMLRIMFYYLWNVQIQLEWMNLYPHPLQKKAESMHFW